MNKVVIIDGKSVFYRGYYAMASLSLPDGTPTGGVYGFMAMLLTILDELKPTNIIVAWDKKGSSTARRVAIYPEYKAGRKMPPEDFFVQIPILRELLDGMNIPLVELDGYEADDLMGALAQQAAAQDFEVALVTGDLDLLQVVGKNITVYATKTGFSKIEAFDRAHFEHKYKIKLEQFADYKALRGDSSDNIPGVAGIGPKAAVELLAQYADLDTVYEHLDEIKPSLAKKLEASREMAFLSQKLVRIMTEAPVKFVSTMGLLSGMDVNQSLNALEKLEFRSLRSKLAKILGAKELTSSDPQVGLFLDDPDVDYQELSSSHELVEKLQSSDKILIEIIDQKIFCSNISDELIYALPLSLVDRQMLDFLRSRLVISSDIKQLLHNFGATNWQSLDDLPVDKYSIYDINQASFLLDPLARDSEIKPSVNQLPKLKQLYQQQLTIWAKLPKLTDVAKRFDFPMTLILYLAEKRGVEIDQHFFQQFGGELQTHINQLTAEIYQVAGQEFNINSPQQLGQILFEKLALPTKGLKKRRDGFSTDRKTLDLLNDVHPIIPLIKNMRELVKLKTTYVDPLPTMVDEQSRLHTTFTQNVTSTGRLSSLNPNLQNIPVRSEWGNRLRQGFIAGKGKVLLAVDYAQFELRLAAALAHDEEMIAIFNADRDVHTEMAAQIYQIDVKDVTKDQRRVAKTVNFSVLYGAGPRNLMQTVGNISFAEAKQMIDRWFEARHKIRNYLDSILKQAEEQGFVETYFGRRRPTPDIKSSNFQVREAAKRASANMPIQGTEADLMKLAMIQIEEFLNQYPDSDQILQIHDSVLIECVEKDVEAIRDGVINVMVNICPELGVKLAVDAKIGKSWFGL
ncbi:MAG: DNA polymerase [Candidatus Saccharibacteria bacterium]|nr:DNA polymerase [Candidatus Saccharibacteria bacterium]